MSGRVTSALGTLLLAAACSAAACKSGEQPPIATLSVPGLASANVSLAAAGEVVAAAWGARAESGATDIYAAISRDAGGTFGTPVLVSGSRHDAQLNAEQPARVAVVPRPDGMPAVVVVWPAKGANGTELLAARSDDAGATFGDAETVPGSAAAGNRGWLSVSAQSDGRVAILWLDHRELAGANSSAEGMSHEGHAGHGQTDGAARAQLSKLYFGWVDGVQEGRSLTGGVCYCCKTAVATDANGSVYAAWRHVYSGNVRDIAFMMSRDRGASFGEPARVSEDGWVLDGCPENGPAIAVNASGRIHVVWPTLVAAEATDGDPTLALFAAVSNDGRRFTPRHQLTTAGTPYRPQIAINDADDVTVAWEELRGGVRHVMAGRNPAGAEPTAFDRRELAAPASDPAIAAAGRGFVVGWTDTSQKPTRIVIQRLP